MPLSGYIIEGRAHLLARIKLLFDLLLAAGLYASGAPMITLLAPAMDVLLLLPCLRVVGVPRAAPAHDSRPLWVTAAAR